MGINNNTDASDFSKAQIFSSNNKLLGIYKIDIHHNGEEIIAIVSYFGTNNKFVSLYPDFKETGIRRVATLDRKRLRRLVAADAEVRDGKLWIDGHHKYDKPCVDPLLPDFDDYIYATVSREILVSYANFSAKKEERLCKLSFGRGFIRGPGQEESIKCKARYPDLFNVDLWKFEATINTGDLFTVVNYLNDEENYDLYLCLPVDKDEKNIIFWCNYSMVSVRCVDYLNNVKW